jgi:hypothetical protein
LTKGQIDKMAILHNGNLTKWQVAKWQNIKLTNWLIGKTIKSNIHRIDKMASRQNSKLTKWQFGKITS